MRFVERTRVIPPEADAEFVAGMEEVLETYARPYDQACPVIVVCDNLNTHTKGAFYQVFEPERARQLVRRLAFRHTPRHGSWLNIAENELSAMTRQCVTGRRFGDIRTLQRETTAWSSDVNRRQKGVDWQMKVDDARTKLASVCPQIQM